MRSHRGDTTGNTLMAIVAILALVLLAAAAFRVLQQRQMDRVTPPAIDIDVNGNPAP